jgi:hypothetical protein
MSSIRSTVPARPTSLNILRISLRGKSFGMPFSEVLARFRARYRDDEGTRTRALRY